MTAGFLGKPKPGIILPCASVNGLHLYLAVFDSTGRTIGGHLLDGCRVYTTAEIVLGELPQLAFRREPDATFGYQALVVRPALAPVTSPADEKRKARQP